MRLLEIIGWPFVSRPKTPNASVQEGKIIGIHHRLGSLSGHRYTEAVGSLEEYGRRGRKVLLFINKCSSPEITQSLRAQAVLDDPTFRLEWSFDERTRLFSEMLHTHITPVVASGDRVYLTVATQLEANALARWLRELPMQKWPWIIVVFLSDRWNRHGAAEYERQSAEFRKLRETLLQLTREELRRLLFFSVSESLCNEIGQFLGQKVGCVPIALRYEPAPLEKEEHHIAPSSPRVAVLGGLRTEKGSARLPSIVRACAELMDVRFCIQMVNEGLSDEDYAAVLALSNEPRITAIPSELQIDEYAEAMKASDLALFPYEVTPYRQRTSAVFAEAVAYGKPSVVPAGTWLAGEIEAGRAAGIICHDLSAEGYAKAISACVTNLLELTLQAQSLAAEWRKNVSITRFTDIVEQEIAHRERD